MRKKSSAGKGGAHSELAQVGPKEPQVLPTSRQLTTKEVEAANGVASRVTNKSQAEWPAELPTERSVHRCAGSSGLAVVSGGQWVPYRFAV